MRVIGCAKVAVRWGRPPALALSRWSGLLED
jgi:hypothetical protein